MTRIAFVTWDGGGNNPPAIGLAQELISRGHEVLFIGYEVQRKSFERKGFKFEALRRSGSFDAYQAEPAQRIPALVENVWASAEHLDDIPDSLALNSPDVLVVDVMMQGALASAACLGVPVAVLVHSSIAALVPPPDSPKGAGWVAAANQLRATAGLAPLTRLNDAWAGFLTLVATIPDLDPSATIADSSVHYIGPVFERFPDATWDSPWDAEDDRPLVLVSFTTTRLWDQTGRIRNTLDALASEPLRVLVSAPQSLDVAPVPPNAAVRGFVAHKLVLPEAAVTVTHAGHGTVAASLAHGVPLVALPNPAADQPFLAATVERLAAGLALDGESGPEAIRTAVQEVIGRPSYAAAARGLGDTIRAAPGAAGAAVELERLTLTGRPSADPGLWEGFA